MMYSCLSQVRGELSHKFPLNLGPDPHCAGVEGILGAYEMSRSQVELYGPTNFSPVIKEVLRSFLLNIPLLSFPLSR